MSPVAVSAPSEALSAEEAKTVNPLPNLNSKASFIDHFRTHGYCVVPSVIPKERCDQYTDEALSWLEGFNLGFDRNDKSTWKVDNLPINGTGGLYGQYCIGHEAFVWKIRQEPGVIKVFQELWGTDELLVSFDGANITFPYGEHGRTDVPMTKPWPHQDQPPRDDFFLLAQGIAAISESGPNDGGLVVLAGSHLLHPKFYEEHPTVDDEKIKANGGKRLKGRHYSTEEFEWYKAHGAKETKVTCPAGSVILWDSRLIHWNCTPTGDRTRVATYVCYCPASKATEEEREKKAWVYQQRYGSGHVPVIKTDRMVRNRIEQRNGAPDPAGESKLLQWLMEGRTRPANEPIETPLLLKLAGVQAY